MLLYGQKTGKGKKTSGLGLEKGFKGRKGQESFCKEKSMSYYSGESAEDWGGIRILLKSNISRKIGRGTKRLRISKNIVLGSPFC